MIALLIVGLHLAQQSAPTWRIEPMLRIGAVDDETHALSRVGGVAVTSRGDLLVAQPDERHIKVFDRNGRFIRRIGREGSGPGEFRGITAISLHNDRLSVLDIASGRLTEFDAPGRVVAVHRAPAIRVPEPYLILPPIAVLPDGRRYVFPDSRGGVSEYPFFVVDRDGTVRQIGRLLHGGRSVRVQPRRMIGVIPRPVHSGTLHAIDLHSGDVIFVERPIASSRRSHTWQLIRVAASGDTVFLRNFSYDPVPIDRATVEREKQKQIELSMQLPGGGRVAFPREEVEALWHAGYQVPPYQSAIDEIMLAANGEIWLRRGAFGEPRSEWLIMDNRGERIGSLTIPSSSRLVWASDRNVVLVERDALDVEYVTLHRLLRS
jgi:hypothetical protein